MFVFRKPICESEECANTGCSDSHTIASLAEQKVLENKGRESGALVRELDKFSD